MDRIPELEQCVAERDPADALRRDIRHAVDQIDRGEGTPWDPEEIKAEGRRLIAARRAKA